MRVRGALAGLVLAAALVAGCGGDGDGDSGDGGGPTTEDTGDDGGDTATGEGERATSRACGLLTTDEVSELFGEPAEVVPGEAGVDDVASNCLWQAEVGDADAPTLYQLELSVYGGGEPLDSSLWGGEPEPLDGPGDEAFVVRSDATGGTTAGFREDGTAVLLRYGILLGEDAPDPSTQSDEVVGLLEDVAERLG